MKFSCSVEINSPVNKVSELFVDDAKLNKWQDGFIRTDLISGTHGSPGAKSRIIFKLGNHEMELIETIISKNLPSEIIRLYEHKHMINTMTNSFISVDKNKTKLNTEIEYTKFIGFMPKMMSVLMPGLFRKQTQKWLENFKSFAETQNS